MDFAYDHITERSISNDRSNTATPKPADPESTTPTNTQPVEPPRATLQSEFQESFKAFSNSPWGKQLGGWWSTAKDQAASTYEVARKEAEKREQDAARVLEEARKAVVEKTKVVVEAAEEQLDNLVNEDKKAEKKAEEEQRRRDPENTDETSEETFLTRLQKEAARRLQSVQSAEEKADEALSRFGTNIKSFLAGAVTVTAPEREGEVLFESRDGNGKRVIHASRFDAQLHVIHTMEGSFLEDPVGEEWTVFRDGFDVEGQTERIGADLERFDELRKTMESLVPEKVEYKDFWTRYYFLRHVVEVREEKRKELLKASTDQEEEVGWDEDSDGEKEVKKKHSRTDSDAVTLKAARRSHDEKSVADSEASYDVVSGAASHANSSPKEKPLKIKEEDSDDDWE